MNTYFKLLEKVYHQNITSRQLSFGNGHISRDLLKKELSLGEGSIKTLVKHLKTTNMIMTSNAGTILTDTGERIISQILVHIPKETIIPKSSITVGKFNYVVLVKNIANSIHSGIEQRDIAIKSGAMGATTLIFKDGKFLISGTNFNALVNELHVQKILIENLHPNNNDVIIIGSDNQNKQHAEIAAKNAALFTLMNNLKY